MELTIERIAMIAALAAMGGAIGVKIITIQLFRAMENSINAVYQARTEAQRALQRTLSKKNVGQRDLTKLERKKQKTRSQIRKLRGELNDYKKHESDRQKQRNAVRGKVEEE
ncbi:MAG: hypothetical protein ACI906_000557 [Candidatus Latescibacterota bacterium]